MAKRVIWSMPAQQDRKNIFEYWNERNKSKSYSIKLNEVLKTSVKFISAHPNIGRKTDFKNVRLKVIRDYNLFYEITNDSVNILRVWDYRREPNKLKL